jgi:hypothetical protein
MTRSIVDGTPYPLPERAPSNRSTVRL